MTTTSYTPQTSQDATIAMQIFAALGGGFLLFLAGLFVWTLGYQLVYAGRIFPGVSVAGVDLSGISPADAAVRLNQQLTFPYSGQILLRDGDRIWATTPAELGMVFDASASAQSAYKLGRSGGLFGGFSDQLDARQKGKSAQAAIIFDQNVAYAYLQRLALEIDQPPIEATLAIHGTEVVAQPGQLGRYLNVDSALIQLSMQLQTFRDGELMLFVDEVHPQLIDVSSQAEIARQILSAPLTLGLSGATENDPGPWVFDVQTVAEMLIVRRADSESGSTLEVVLETGALYEMLIEIGAQVDRPAENPRFIFNDETRQLDLLRPAVIGRVVDIEGSVAFINQSILDGAHEIVVQVVSDNPAVLDTTSAAELGITELVRSETSYFYGSSAPRIQNIQTAAAAFHGVLIAPGETFSMGSVLDDISLENGFTEALIIYGGRTIKGVGGGVCQVSTTLFRTAFFAGFPIAERHSHAYRVSYYEQNPGGGRDLSLVGLDATVYFPLVDFKFTNDTSNWLLMETYMDVGGRNLTWKFYSTSDGRSIDWNASGPQNIVSPPGPLIQESDELEEGQIRQVDWEADGADVSVSRTVFRGGTIINQDVFNTHYEPWQAVCEVGTGTEDPEKLAKKTELCQ